MSNKKLIYNIGEGKLKESSIYYNDSNNTLNTDILSSSNLSINLQNGILFSNNNILSSSQQDNSIVQWNATSNRWELKSILVDIDNNPPSINSDIYPSSLTNVTVKNISNATTGNLKVANGGTGLSSSQQFPSFGENLFYNNGSSALSFIKKEEIILKDYKFHILAPLTASAAIDISDNNNTLELFNASYVTNAPTTPFGDNNALSCSFTGDDSTNNSLKARATSPKMVGDFTIECWVYLLNNGSHGNPNVRSGLFSIRKAESGVNTFEVFVNDSGQFTLWTGGVTGLITTSNPTLTTTNNTWQHVSLVRKGDSLKLYVNGVGSSPIKFGSECTNDEYIYDFIGSVQWGGGINGYITEYSRVPYAKSDGEIATYYLNVRKGLQGRRNKNYISINDEKLYKPVILSALTSSMKTEVSSYTSSLNIVKGSITTAPAGLFGGNAFSSSYDANTANYAASINLPRPYIGDFTIEGWINLANVGNSGDGYVRCVIFGDNTNNYAFGLSGSANGTTGKYSLWRGDGTLVTNLDFTPNVWTHVAMVKSEDIVTLYVNGVASDPILSTVNNTNSAIMLGTNGNATWNINGFMTEIFYAQYAKSSREIKAYYDSVIGGTFTRYNKDSTHVNTFNVYKPYALAPLTGAVSNDISYNNNTIELLGGATYSTTPAGLPVSILSNNVLSSSYSGADSTDASRKMRITYPAQTGDFTIECWVYLTNVGSWTDSNAKSGVMAITGGGKVHDITISSTGEFRIYDGGSASNTATGLFYTQNGWQHVCLVRKGYKLYFYKNGMRSPAIALHSSMVNISYNVDYVASTNWGGGINGFATEYSHVPYAKSKEEIYNYYNSVINGSQGRLSTNTVTANYNLINFKPTVLASLSSSDVQVSNTYLSDTSIYNNPITLIKGQIAKMSGPDGLWSDAISSSYDATDANYTGYISLPYAYNGDFTVEGWVFLSNVGNSPDAGARCVIFSNENNNRSVGIDQNGYIHLWTGENSATSWNPKYTQNAWMHVALVKRNNSLRACINGVPSAELGIGDVNSSFSRITIGSTVYGRWNINGYIAGVSFVQYAKTDEEIRNYCNLTAFKGIQNKDYVSKFDSTLYVPNRIAPLTQLKYNDDSIYENDLLTYNADYLAPPIQSPFGPGNVLSCSFSGPATYDANGNDTSRFKATLTNLNKFSGDFTISSWIYLNNYGSASDPNYSSVMFSRLAEGSTIDVALSSGGTIRLWPGDIGPNTSTGLTASLNTWNNIVLVRKGYSFQVFLNGIGGSIIPMTPPYNLVYKTDFIGSTWWGNAMNGYITEYISFPYARTAVEIKNYYNSVISGSQARITKTFSERPIADNYTSDAMLVSNIDSTWNSSFISNNRRTYNQSSDRSYDVTIFNWY